MPYEAANVKIFPRQFLKLNKNGMPAFGLLVSSIIMQVFMCLVVTSKQVYLAALDLTSLMVLPAYLFSGIFLWKASLRQKLLPDTNGSRRGVLTFIGVMATLFCSYIIFATDWTLLLISVIFYMPGTYFYIRARRQYAPGQPVFHAWEKWLCAALAICAIAGIVLMLTGRAHL